MGDDYRLLGSTIDYDNLENITYKNESLTDD